MKAIRCVPRRASSASPDGVGMIRILIAAIALLVGTLLGWFLLGGFCSIPGLKYSNACGHNAYIWIPIFIPLSVYMCWRTLNFLIHRFKK